MTDEQFSELVIYLRREFTKKAHGAIIAAVRQPEPGVSIVLPNGEACRTLLLKNYQIFDGDKLSFYTLGLNLLIGDVDKEIQATTAGIINRSAPAWIETLGWTKSKPGSAIYRRDHPSGVYICRLASGDCQVNSSVDKSFCLAAFRAIEERTSDFVSRVSTRCEWSPRYSADVAEEVTALKNAIVALHDFYQLARASEY